LQDPAKFTQIGTFGLKIYHLATMVFARAGNNSVESRGIEYRRKGFFEFRKQSSGTTLVITKVNVPEWLPGSIPAKKRFRSDFRKLKNCKKLKDYQLKLPSMAINMYYRKSINV
jgi:hypothetical protein